MMERRPKNHRDMMSVIHRCLKPEGVAFVHTIANIRSLRHGTPFIEKYIFPNAVAPSLTQIGKAIEACSRSRTCTTSASTTTRR